MRLRHAAATVLTFVAATASAQTIVANTFGPGDSFFPFPGYSVAAGYGQFDQSVAAPFVAAAGGRLSTIRIAAGAPLTFDPAGPLFVGLYRGSDMNTATLLEQFSGFAPRGNGEIVSFTSTLHPLITASQSYFVALSVDEPTATLYAWNMNDQGTTGAVWTDATGPWSALQGQEPAYDVTVTGTVTPEPEAVWLLGSGLAAIAWAVRRRRRGVAQPS